MNSEYVKDYIAVIQAGGKGSRMRSFTKDIIPKPMLEIDGNPMIYWQMSNLASYGIRHFVIITGHLGHVIENYFRNGEDFGYYIDYIREDVAKGSAGSLSELKQYPASGYLLVFGDVMFDFDVTRMMEFHLDKKAKITLLAHPNSHPYDSDLLCIDSDFCVSDIIYKGTERKAFYQNCVNAGIYLLEKEIINKLDNLYPKDMEKDIVLPYIKYKNVFVYLTSEYIKDAGTPDRYRSVCKDKSRGLWSVKNLGNMQKAIFLDRDGTINKYKGLIKNIDQLELEDNSAEAIRMINESEYLAIVITNQPVIARGDCTIEDLQQIHNKMETLLGGEGAYVDAIYYCPHHPDSGYPGERPEYKISCKCRKPGTILVEEAVRRFNINLKESFIVGDSTRDIMLGVKTGMGTILVHTGESGKDGKYDVVADREVDDLLEAVKLILKGDEDYE